MHATSSETRKCPSACATATAMSLHIKSHHCFDLMINGPIYLMSDQFTLLETICLKPDERPRHSIKRHLEAHRGHTHSHHPTRPLFYLTPKFSSNNAGSKCTLAFALLYQIHIIVVSVKHHLSCLT